MECPSPLGVEVITASSGEVSSDTDGGVYIDGEVHIKSTQRGGCCLYLLGEEGIGEVHELDKLIPLVSCSQGVFAHDVGAVRAA